MVNHSDLAAALLQASEPKPPTQPKPFDYSLSEAIARAKGGSVTDARMLLLLAAGILSRPIPAAFGNAILPGELAAYVGEALHKAARGTDAKRALRLVRNKGRSAATNAERDAWIAYIVETFKARGRRDFLAATADMLADACVSLPAGGAWTRQAVRDAIGAHRVRTNQGIQSHGRRL